MMGETRPDVLVSCLRVIELLADPALAPLLASHARAKEASVRAAAVAALAVLPPLPAVVTALDEARFDTDETVRLGALAAVANRLDGEAAPRTAAFRSDPSQAVRMTVAWELGRFADPGSQAALRELACDPIPEVAAVALGTLLAPADEAALRDFGPALGRASPEAKARLRSDARAAEITAALGGLLASHRLPDVRCLAVGAVKALAFEDFERHLLPSLADPSPAVRLAAVQALTPLDRPAIRERLRALLDDPDLDVREAVKSAKVLALR
jgi:HEAT repeat protein